MSAHVVEAVHKKISVGRPFPFLERKPALVIFREIVVFRKERPFFRLDGYFYFSICSS
jgi:hypothetical protein